MYTLQTFAKVGLHKLAALIFLSLTWVACKPNDLEFQSFQPKSETALADLFKDTPAIRAAFTTVDPHEFNVRLDKLMQFDPVMGVKTMHALGALSKDRPALPQLADSISATLDRFARFYQSTPARKDEYNAAIDLVNRLLDVDPKAITDGAYLLARGVRYAGESEPLFPKSYFTAYVQPTPDLTYAFPVLSTWQTCDDPGSVFLNGKPKSDITDLEGRDALWSLYDILRTGFCIYANRSGPRIEIAGGSLNNTYGRAAKGEAIVSSSNLTGITITDAGIGYTATPVVNIDSSPGPGSGATATAVLGPTWVPIPTVASPGTGYTAVPTITINQSECPGVTATGTVLAGQLATVSIVNYASGCNTATPQATVTGGGVGASGAAVSLATAASQKVVSITMTSQGGGYVPKSDNSPGAYMRNATAVLKNSGDVELRIRNLIYDLQNKLSDYTDAEKRIADWTVNQSNIVFQSQVAVTDYLIDHIYPITRKDFVFNDGKEVLDREAEHLSMKNPGGTVAGNDQYLLEWLAKSAAADAPKLDDMENFSDVDTTSKLYVFGKDLVENANYGINNVTGRYDKSRLKELVWGPKTYTSNNAAPQNFSFSGLLYSDGASGYGGDGYLTRLAQVKSTQNYHNPFRNFMSTRINSLVTVPATYNNEFYLEAALKNFYFHVLDRYYDQTTNQWALTPEDAQTLFAGDSERNLQSYIGQMQYSMRNMAILDKKGKQPGDAGFDNIPYLTSFLYTIAAANGYVDPVDAPKNLTLQDCLKSMGSPLAAGGQIHIDIDILGLFTIPMDISVLNAPVAQNSPRIYSATRQNEGASSSLNMFAFELISPGRFIPRADSELYPSDPVNGKFRGSFSPHQGDIESTNVKTSNWMVSEFSLAAWEGFGPYSVKGRAANGSRLKYENDYYTDGYRAAMGTSYGFSGPPTSYSEVAMGENGGMNGGTLGNGRNGNYHMYEMIYRPMSAADQCWVEAQGSTYGYARYGWIRPSNDTAYTNLNTVTNNCDINTAVRLDFDTRDEAIRANIEWVLKYKKYVFVIPISSASSATAGQAAAFAVFSSINANGLWGVTTAHRAGSAANMNGHWNKGNFGMGANGNGYIASLTRGFIDEAPAGGRNGVSIGKTARFGVTSYAAGDSMVLLDTTMRTYGFAITWLVDLWAQIWGSLGDGPVTPAMIKDNFDSVLTLAQAVYQNTDILCSTAFHASCPNYNGTESTMAKFRKFYDTYFPTDETNCVGGVLVNGANGTPDLYENYANGCGVLARDLPPVPKVNPNTGTCNEFVQTSCITYPSAFNATTGAPTAWAAFKGPSDGKLTGMLTPLVILFGTMHEDGAVQKVTTYPNAALLAAGENRDNVAIRNFCSNGAPGCPSADVGYRVELDTLFTALSALNESVMYNNGQACDPYGQQPGATPCSNFPQYSNLALTNILTESAAGLRNGLVPKLTNNKYANLAYIDPLVRDIESMIADNVRKAEDGLTLTTGTTISAKMKNKDRLRYFITKNAVNPSFTAKTTVSGYVSADNHGLELNDRVFLTGAVPAGTTANTEYFVVAPVTADSFRLSATQGGPFIALGVAPSYTVNPWLFKTNKFNSSVNGVALNGVPMNMLKQFVAYLRTLTSDTEIVAAIKAAIPVLNNYLANVQNSTSQISLTDADIDHIVSFIRDTNKTGGYSVDTFLDMLVSTKMDDLNTLRSFNFNQFKTLGSYQTVFDDMNDKISKYFDVDIKKDLLYSPFLLGEPTCPGGSANGFYDHNKDGVWNPGTFTFISAAYAGASSYTDTANVNGGCTITTQIPNIYDKDYYMLDMGGVGRNIDKAVNSLTVDDIDNKLNWLYGRVLLDSKDDVVYAANTLNGGKVECHIKPQGYGTGGANGIKFDREIKALKNLLLCEIYNKKISEPHYDRNGNNIIEAGEYTDVNGNNQYDDENTTVAGDIMNLRKLIHYYMEDVFVPKYNEYIQPDPLSPSKNYVHFGATALEDLLSPTTCDSEGLNCSVNSKYLTADLLVARSTFYASTNFTSAELRSVKNVVGNFLYDVDTGQYTELVKLIAQPRAGFSEGPAVMLLREFQGDYNDLLSTGLEGFKPDGFMTYFSTNLKNQSPYTSLDILTDVRTLFNTQVMRCYPGITGEYFGGPSYCKKYKAKDTFWGQFGMLMDQFSTAAYNKYKAQWQGQMSSPYYSRLVSIFE